MSMILVVWQLLTELWVHLLVVLIVLYLISLGQKKKEIKYRNSNR
jgi:uncharacterized protein (DUF983 family)